MCVCVAIICVLFDFDSARSVVAQQSCHWEERPLWSIVLCTEESYKLVTGKDWPGDGDSSVVLRKFQDGETRKVIAVTRGIKGAWEETCNFSFKESCVMPKDNGQLVFQDLQQQQTLNLKRMQIIWNKFLSVSALHMPSSLAFPPTLQVVQDELKGLTMLPFAPGLADTPGALDPATPGRTARIEGISLFSSPAARAAILATGLAPSPEDRLVPALPGVGEAEEAEDAAAEESEDGGSAAAPEPEPRAARASLLGSMDDDEQADDLRSPEAKVTRESKASDAVQAVRKAFMQYKQNLWKMNSDAKLEELTRGSLRPGYLVTKLSSAKTTAMKVLKDKNLTGNLETEATEQKVMAEAIAVWKQYKLDSPAIRLNAKFLESMQSLRNHKSLVAVLPMTAIGHEKCIEASNAISNNQDAIGFIRIDTLRRQSPSLSLCTPQDLELLQLRILKGMVNATLVKSHSVVGMEEKGVLIGNVLDHTTGVSGPPQNVFFTVAVAVVVSDIRQVALGKTLILADESTDNCLADSLARMQKEDDTVQCAIYKLFREHRQTGEKLFDRAIVLDEQNKSKNKFTQVKAGMAGDISELGQMIQDFVGSGIGIGHILSLKDDEQPALVFVRAANVINEKLNGPEMLSWMRSDPEDVNQLRKEFGIAWRPLVAEFANKVNEFLNEAVKGIMHADPNQSAAEQKEQALENFASLKERVQTQLVSVKDQWEIMVEPFIETIVASEKTSQEKLLIEPQSVQAWITALGQLVVAIGTFWASIDDWDGDLMPSLSEGANDAIMQGIMECLTVASKSETSRAAFASLSKCVAKILAILPMKDSQQKAYDKWLGSWLFKCMSLGKAWCQSDSGVLQMAVADLKEHTVKQSVQDIVAGLKSDDPWPQAEILQLAEFQQPKEQADIAHDIALSSGAAHIQSGLIRLLLAFSTAKQMLVKIHVSVAGANGRLNPLIAVLKMGDEFKALCDEIDVQRQGDSVGQELRTSCLAEMMVAKEFVHTQVSKKYVDIVTDTMSNLMASVPSDYQDIVRSQIHNSIRGTMFTKKALKLVEGVDAMEVSVSSFKVSQLLQLGADDDVFISKWSMIRSNMAKLTQFALTWEAVDLLLNKFPKAPSQLSKAALYREFS